MENAAVPPGRNQQYSPAAIERLAIDEALLLREALDILRPAAVTASVVMAGVPTAAPEMAAFNAARDRASDLYGRANAIRAQRLQG